MQYKELMDKVGKKLTTLGFELMRCNDIYRLHHLLKSINEDIDVMQAEAYGMIKELEGEEEYPLKDLAVKVFKEAHHTPAVDHPQYNKDFPPYAEEE